MLPAGPLAFNKALTVNFLTCCCAMCFWRVLSKYGSDTFNSLFHRLSFGKRARDRHSNNHGEQS